MSSHLENAEDVDFIIKTAIERDPNKRRVKPVETQASILDFDLEESSDDSDFRIEDHPDLSDDDSIDSNGEGGKDSSSGEEDEEDNDSDASADFNELQNLQLSPHTNGLSVADVIQQAARQSNVQFNEKDANLLICCGCLGDQSDGINEIAECDGCGVTVHEACYGISDSNSLASTDSLSPTTPWFCEACKAGVQNPVCELCPNSGGVFKETDVGKWVHLVCALYVPGVAFGEVDKLSSVTLFEMQYNKWGAKCCSLCLDQRFSRTGVCIGCDAGMCRNYFHVTCAQREGFLSEAHSEEQDQADPFYAHCKLHSDKTLVKRRKRNYMSLQLRTHYRKLQFEKEGHSETPEQLRIQRKLAKKKMHYMNLKSLKTPPWVPTQKMPRLLTTSASACRKLLQKADLMGIDSAALEMQEAQMAALVDIRKKWHIPPAFTVEFIAYYLDRNDRVKSMKDTLESLLSNNQSLLRQQQDLRNKYDELLKVNNETEKTKTQLKQSIHKYHSAILSACPTKSLPNVDDIGKPPPSRPPPQQMMVPTAAALKMGVGFPLSNIPANRNDTGRILSSHAARQDPLQLNECGICRQHSDQHMLAKCDTCHLFYHLNCLNPPLSRLPKKSKLYGWQCSECDKTSDSEPEEMKTPRRSRSRYSKEDTEVFAPKVKIKPVEPTPNSDTIVIDDDDEEEEEEEDDMVQPPYLMPEMQLELQEPTPPPPLQQQQQQQQQSCSMQQLQPMDVVAGYINNPLLDSSTGPVATADGMETMIISRSGKKRRRDKHRNRYSPDMGGPVKEHKRKRKKKSLDIEDPIPHKRITIKIKPIPLPAGEVASTTNPQCFYVNNDETPPPSLMIQQPTPTVYPVEKPPPTKQPPTGANVCDVCQQDGLPSNLVKCDECQKNYHFTCLDPPLKKTPKKRGYSWHCADCDPTGSE
ncbi:PREDICTED: PHD finger protein 14 isoform X2 [Nicrophorus vespilloides]|uniref:PHD finger protein 14 isoform X2 n=1 Tax=Nicrophorus vespilloides TaxID=110193 RepID=A0ABM1M4B1_NICVS|nr:PREDICTED: PHD finger protein 14 isoform X2 [Nicrophorus vespilloides]